LGKKKIKKKLARRTDFRFLEGRKATGKKKKRSEREAARFTKVKRPTKKKKQIRVLIFFFFSQLIPQNDRTDETLIAQK
jgi:hypothetical protein